MVHETSLECYYCGYTFDSTEMVDVLTGSRCPGCGATQPGAG